MIEDRFTVDKMQHGGFVVISGPRHPSERAGAIFASTTLDEALAFIRAKFEGAVKESGA